MSTAREIIHQADELRNEAKTLENCLALIYAAPAGPITELGFGRVGAKERVTLPYWSNASEKALDLRSTVAEAYSSAIARLLEQADALDVQVQVVGLR